MQQSDFILEGYKDLEISTQIVIRSALARGIEVEILNRPAHFLRLRQGSHVEYIKEASKTRLDSYITFLIMEDKHVSKLLLSEAGLPVPKGGIFTDAPAAKAELRGRIGKPTVIKPNSTNFGLGVRVFANGGDLSLYEEALDTAFAHDTSVIIEDYIAGDEYRFLVIAGECAAVCRRIPANVTGDGRSSIQELIEQKNADVRRGRGHRTPLEKIDLDETVLAHLGEQGLSPESILEKDKLVYLRKNSNISTGGDSIDETRRAHPFYKELSVQAARAAGAQICGVDIITEDLQNPPHGDQPSCAILEINFNPVLYIHEFPYQGDGQKIGDRILDALGFEGA